MSLLLRDVSISWVTGRIFTRIYWITLLAQHVKWYCQIVLWDYSTLIVCTIQTLIISIILYQKAMLQSQDVHAMDEMQSMRNVVSHQKNCEMYSLLQRKICDACLGFNEKLIRECMLGASASQPNSYGGLCHRLLTNCCII